MYTQRVSFFFGYIANYKMNIIPLLCVVIKLTCTNIINLSYEKTQMSVYIITLNTLCHVHVCNAYMLC